MTPTDTVYGLGVSIKDDDARARLLRLKPREVSQFITLVGSWEQLNQVAAPTPRQLSVLKSYWPGAITFVLPRKTDTAHTIAVRWPDDPFLLRWIEWLGCPMLSTSANPPGFPTVTSVDEAMRCFGDGVSVYVAATRPRAPVPSTLVDLTADPYRVLRRGPVTFP
jgi:L-threonylcarbamoyladenylate synthase